MANVITSIAVDRPRGLVHVSLDHRLWQGEIKVKIAIGSATWNVADTL